ncbi:bifunctional (p)ppGpp synthetase/guanosine-3',5'-bis(diphosphate) 3'-pyrophosphohydrolase [Clostridia bacterium]|nr:bifunctional (p)ppGpp synthetase/guanosine-3',5'-bis(diphosphate) 3'-pyrophosphohydrolase [Clostridia bacterium]
MTNEKENLSVDKLIERIKEYNPDVDGALIQKAYHTAFEAHKGQERKSGEEYIIHPLNVAFILANFQMDTASIVAGLLHDVVEDTVISLEEVEKEFGEEVALLVDGVTKLSMIQYKDREEHQVENLRKMLLAMAKDIRVIMIKLSDRLHNMRTLKYMSIEKQKRTSQETLEIYAPLAHRLGVFRIKWELEDLALKHLEPESYRKLVQTISMKRKEREEYINSVIEILKKEIEELNISVDIQGRPKHFFSIYNKMTKQNKELSEIYDLIAIRIILDNVKDCYAVLGVIHTLWKPIPGRFKDYIAMPKPNMYQSLHTTVIGPGGEPFEVQIRTWEMHRTSEFGVAAHWEYKEGKRKGSEDINKQFSWFRNTIIDLQKDTGNAKDFIDTLKTDIFSNRVYVFTPKGDVIELKQDSTPIDFAYMIHTDIGNRAVGAKVNGKMVQFDHKLKTGDIVEVKTSRSGKPSMDWLKIVATTQAKNKIRNYFKKLNRDQKIDLGRDLLMREMNKERLNMKYAGDSYMEQLIKIYSMNAFADMYAAIGDNGLTATQVVNRMKDIAKKENKETLSYYEKNIKPWGGYGKASNGVRVKGIDDTIIRISRCCNPIPDDAIGGYVSRGAGISVHRQDCANFKYLKKTEPERIIEVAWDNKQDSIYQVMLEIIGINRSQLALDVMKVLNDAKTTTNSFNARVTKDLMAQIDVKILINDLGHLEFIIQRLMKINDVINVKRVTPRKKGWAEGKKSESSRTKNKK